MNKDMVKSFIHSHQHAMSLCVICLLTVCAFLPSYLLERIPDGVG